MCDHDCWFIHIITQISCVGGFGSNSHMYKINGTANINAVNAASEKGINITFALTSIWKQMLISFKFQPFKKNYLCNVNMQKLGTINIMDYFDFRITLWIILFFYTFREVNLLWNFNTTDLYKNINQCLLYLIYFCFLYQA